MLHNHLLKKLISQWIVLISFMKSVNYKYKGLFLDSDFYSIGQYVYSYDSIMLYCVPQSCKLWTGKVWVLQLYSPFLRLFCLFWNLGLYDHLNNFAKKLAEIFGRYIIKWVDQFSENYNLCIKSSDLWASDVF